MIGSGSVELEVHLCKKQIISDLFALYCESLTQSVLKNVRPGSALLCSLLQEQEAIMEYCFVNEEV